MLSTTLNTSNTRLITSTIIGDDDGNDIRMSSMISPKGSTNANGK
jgi:hypothetical protein